MKFFTGTIEYNIENGDGVIAIKQSYLVEAISVSDVETKMVKVLPDNYKEKHVLSVASSTIAEIATVGEAETYFLARVGFPVESKKGLKMKYQQTMVNGTSLKDALINLEKFYSRGQTDFEIAGISSSNLICDKDLVTLKQAINL